MKKYKKIFINIVKILIVLAAWIYVANKIYNSTDKISLKTFFYNIDENNILLLFLILFLMFVNWSIETVKWQKLIQQIENINFVKSFKAVWLGVNVGTLTPNRVGEFAGRILVLKPENRKRGTMLTIFGDLSQFITTMCLGIIAYAIIVINFSDIILNNHIIRIFIYTITLALFFSSLFIYFKINNIIAFVSKFKKLNKYISKYIDKFEITNALKIKTLLFSFLRYIIFCFQFYLALKFFNVDISLINTYIACCAVYISVTILPNIALAELGYRLSFSILFFGLFTDKISFISLASLIIYIINVALPAFVGGFFIFKKDKI